MSLQYAVVANIVMGTGLFTLHSSSIVWVYKIDLYNQICIHKIKVKLQNYKTSIDLETFYSNRRKLHIKALLKIYYNISITFSHMVSLNDGYVKVTVLKSIQYANSYTAVIHWLLYRSITPKVQFIKLR